ncbi:MAG: hypothetical protein RBU37_22105 [Myxococcota bacterium]|nr:hypothetical protein [Myxococcota bacterium]
MWLWIGLGVALGTGWLARGMERKAYAEYDAQQREAIAQVQGLGQMESALLLGVVLLAVIINRSFPEQRDLALGLGFVAIAAAGVLVQSLIQRKLRQRPQGKALAGRLLLTAALRFSGMLFMMAVLFLGL